MDTTETGLEKLIVDWLRDHNGYEQETPHAYNKDFALVDQWVERFVTETQPEKVKQISRLVILSVQISSISYLY